MGIIDPILQEPWDFQENTSDPTKTWGGVWVAHASQAGGARVWAGLGRVKANHEKGFGCFMIPRSWAGRVWRRFDAQLLVVEVSREKVTQRSYVFRGTLQMTWDLCVFLFFFHFVDDMRVCVFWACRTTPMSSACTICSVCNIIIST